MLRNVLRVNCVRRESDGVRFYAKKNIFLSRSGYKAATFPHVIFPFPTHGIGCKQIPIGKRMHMNLLCRIENCTKNRQKQTVLQTDISCLGNLRSLLPKNASVPYFRSGSFVLYANFVLISHQQLNFFPKAPECAPMFLWCYFQKKVIRQLESILADVVLVSRNVLRYYINSATNCSRRISVLQAFKLFQKQLPQVPYFRSVSHLFLYAELAPILH